MSLQTMIGEMYSLGNEQVKVEGTSKDIQSLLYAAQNSIQRRADIIQGGVKQAQKTYTDKRIQQVMKQYLLALKVKEDKGVDVGLRYLRAELKDIAAYLKMNMQGTREQYNKILKDREEAPEKLEELKEAMKGLGSYRMSIQKLLKK